MTITSTPTVAAACTRVRWRSAPAVDDIVVPRATTGGLEVRDVSFAIERYTVLLDRISFAARPGTLTAVIGPSGAGKSTLAKLIVGAGRPTGGAVSFEGSDLHSGYASLRDRIGMVPQDDVVHGRLTVAQALEFAAELRMPADTTASERRQVITAVLDELELTPHASTRIDNLSGGQRKRVSVALELLTSPSLLVLDEPTTGLDPALDRSVMAMLRKLADAGRVVVVVTHSLTFLDDLRSGAAACTRRQDRVLRTASSAPIGYRGHRLGRHLHASSAPIPTALRDGSSKAGPTQARDPHGSNYFGIGRCRRLHRHGTVCGDRYRRSHAARYGSLWPTVATSCSSRCCRSSSVCCL